MKLFKTILLSTTLLISVPFASGVVVDDSTAASPARDNAIAETGKKFLAYQEKTAATLYRVLKRDAGDSIPEGTVLSEDSNDLEVMRAIAATLQALTAKLKAMETTAQDATTTIQTLTDEQAAAAEALAAVRKELAAAKEELAAAKEELAAKEARVTELEGKLAAAVSEARTDGEVAIDTIKKLQDALTAAKSEVAELTERAATADNVIKTQRAAEKNLQAALLAQMDAGMNAMDEI